MNSSALPMNRQLYTIGHSTHSIERFISLLSQHSIECLCDVRSNPYSKYNPQFNRDSLRKELEKRNLEYVFLGNELGARTTNPSCYVNGGVQFKLLKEAPEFKDGIEQLLRKTEINRVTLMCAEKDPIVCHRMILVCRNIKTKVAIQHILENGSLESNEESEIRLMKHLRIGTEDLFHSYEELVDMAYDRQGEKIAYKTKDEAD